MAANKEREQIRRQIPTSRFQLASVTLIAAFAASITACSKEQNFGNTTESNNPEDKKLTGTGGVAAGDKPADQASGDNADGSGDPNGGADKAAEGSEGDTGEINGDLLQKTLRDPESLKIDTKEQVLLNLVCKQTFDLDAVSPNKSVPTDGGKLTWETTNPTIIRVDNNGTATVVGYGKVYLIAVSEKPDGTKIQDNVQFEVTPKEVVLIAENATAIKPSVSASATLVGNSFTNFIDGTAGGRIRLRHPLRTITVASIESKVNSTDFSNFKFADITKPKHDPETCSYSVEFDLAFTYFYVPKVTRYNGQQMQVNFAEDTGQMPFVITWSAKLVPEGITGAEADIVVNTGTGTQGFSPKK
jgi:hypothetical protein